MVLDDPDIALHIGRRRARLQRRLRREARPARIRQSAARLRERGARLREVHVGAHLGRARARFRPSAAALPRRGRCRLPPPRLPVQPRPSLLCARAVRPAAGGCRAHPLRRRRRAGLRLRPELGRAWHQPAGRGDRRGARQRGRGGRAGALRAGAASGRGRHPARRSRLSSGAARPCACGGAHAASSRRCGSRRRLPSGSRPRSTTSSRTLRLDEVLAKITGNAQAAVGGKEFVLITKIEDVVVCRSSVRAAGGDAGGARELGDALGRGLLHARDPRRARARCRRWLRSPRATIGAARVALRRAARSSRTSTWARWWRSATGRRVPAPRRRAARARTPPRQRSPSRTRTSYSGSPSSRARTRSPACSTTASSTRRSTASSSAATRSQGHFSVLLLDVDGLKKVNDQHGHAEGDELLRDLAAAIVSVCRTSDLACRIGGDEFAVVLPGTTSAEALAVADRLGERLADLKHKPDDLVRRRRVAEGRPDQGPAPAAGRHGALRRKDRVGQSSLD